MDHDDEEQYRQFLLQSNVDSLLIEFREEDKLRIVCLMDQVADGLSSVYTFFDPDQDKASYGTYCILWQIALASQMNLPFLYLGYWIGDSQKMAYKANFRPLEKLASGRWQAFL